MSEFIWVVLGTAAYLIVQYWLIRWLVPSLDEFPPERRPQWGSVDGYDRQKPSW